jgi:hypothetical protein
MVPARNSRAGKVTVERRTLTSLKRKTVAGPFRVSIGPDYGLITGGRLGATDKFRASREW